MTKEFHVVSGFLQTPAAIPFLFQKVSSPWLYSSGPPVLINEIPPPMVLFNQGGSNLALIFPQPVVSPAPPARSSQSRSPPHARPSAGPAAPFSRAAFTAASTLMKAHLSSYTPLRSHSVPPPTPTPRLIAGPVSAPRTAIFNSLP